MTFLDILLVVFSFLTGPLVVGVLLTLGMLFFAYDNVDQYDYRSTTENWFFWGLWAILVPTVFSFLWWMVITYGFGYNWIPAVDR